jgi:hypothetical protein
MWFLAWLIGLSLLILLVYLQWKRFYILQYLFFLRVPILMGAVLVALPIIAALEGPSQFLGNLFILEHETAFWGALVVAFWACMAAFTIMSVTRLIYLTAPTRYKLPLSRKHHERWLRWQAGRGSPREYLTSSRSLRFLNASNRVLLTGGWKPVRGMVRVRALLFFLLATPILVAIARRSAEVGDVVPPIVLGIGFAVGMRWFTAYLSQKDWVRRQRARLESRWARLARRLLAGFGGQWPLRTFGFFILTVVVYWIGFRLLRPGLDDRFWANQVPALAYVLILTVILTWFFSFLSLALDKWRIPILFAFVAFLLVAFGWFRADHYYRVASRPHSLPPTPTVHEAVDAWARNHPARTQPVMTVVAASGGGITAAYWTATVLRRLQMELGPAFSESIVLVSSTSGGGAGAMYFVDAFSESGAPADSQLSVIVSAAGSSSLGATVWGTAYPDLWRFLTGGSTQKLWGQFLDRGWALETQWLTEGLRSTAAPSSRGLNDRQGRRMLSEWEAGVRAGWRPAYIFNATITESGAPFRLATVDLPGNHPGPTPGSLPKEFVDEYKLGDVSVVTAARLSATFPWVSPIARPWLEVSGSSQAFHLVDGGYFDNWGVYSAIEFLSSFGPGYYRRVLERGRVLLVEIRASAEAPTAAGAGGLIYSLAGPIITMNNVRSSSQIARNELELRMLQSLWARDSVRLCRVVFELGKVAPTSWHLSRAEKMSIESAWQEQEYSLSIEPLRAYLKAEPGVQLAPSSPIDCGEDS